MSDQGIRNYQVLAIDDDPGELFRIKTILAKTGIYCHTVQDEIQALEFIKTGNLPCLILVDTMLPNLPGYGVCRRLRMDYSPVELPVIMFARKEERGMLLKSFEYGANDCITKPFSKEELIARVRLQLNMYMAIQTYCSNLRQNVESVCKKKEKLRYKIKPHLILNALASIRGAIVKEPKAAYQMISHLAEFYKQILSKDGQAIHTLAHEMTIIKSFLAMEGFRLENRLEVSFEIEAGLEKVELPALLLLPLVGNAVKYGSLTCPDQIAIRIKTLAPEPGSIFIRVSNSGFWICPNRAKDYSTGTGLQNTKDLLELYYAGAHQLRIREFDGQVHTTLVFPDQVPPAMMG